MELGIAKNNEIVNSFGDLKYFNPNAQFINFHKPFDIERVNSVKNRFHVLNQLFI